MYFTFTLLDILGFAFMAIGFGWLVVGDIMHTYQIWNIDKIAYTKAMRTEEMCFELEKKVCAELEDMQQDLDEIKQKLNEK